MLPTIGASDVYARPPDPEELHTAHHRIRHPTNYGWFVSECSSQYGYNHTLHRKCVHVFDQLI